MPASWKPLNRLHVVGLYHTVAWKHALKNTGQLAEWHLMHSATSKQVGKWYDRPQELRPAHWTHRLLVFYTKDTQALTGPFTQLGPGGISQVSWSNYCFVIRQLEPASEELITSPLLLKQAWKCAESERLHSNHSTNTSGAENTKRLIRLIKMSDWFWCHC